MNMLGVISMTIHPRFSGQAKQPAIRHRRSVYLFLTTLALLCLALGLTGCGAAEGEIDAVPPSGETDRPPYTVVTGEPSQIVLSSVPGLSLRTEEEEYTGPDIKVRYTLQNETDTIYWFGADSFSIEVLQDGAWYRLAHRTDIENLAFDMVGYGIRPHSANGPSSTDFYIYGDIVPAGTYRLLMELNPETDESVKEYLAAEFEVTG